MSDELPNKDTVKDDTALPQGEAYKTESVAEEEDEQEGMTLLDHLTELRIRMVRAALAALVGFLACYAFAQDIFQILMQPLLDVVIPHGQTLTFFSPAEAFFTYLKASLIAGIFATSPYIFYQLWRFIAPGLYEHERIYLIPIALCSGIFFTGGACFGYFVVFPFAFDFFASFQTEYIAFTPRISECFSFTTKLLFAFGLIFELPLFSFFLARIGLVNYMMMRRFQKYAFLCSFIVGAILTPPDVVSQLFMAGPLIILYEMSIWVAYIFGKRPPKEEAEDGSDGDEAKQSA